jgi:hypothetical protein
MQKGKGKPHLSCEHGSGITVNQHRPMTPTAQKTENTISLKKNVYLHNWFSVQSF